MASVSGPETSSPKIYIPPQWSDAAAHASLSTSPPVVLVCGAKNCGKSTFSRYLLNTLLNTCKKVGYLDTDVGQPEFSPPGFLSLTVIDEVTSGIVRSIDTLKGLLFVITPVPHGTLEKVDLLLQGFIQIPTSLLQVQGSRSPYMSANVLSSS